MLAFLAVEFEPEADPRAALRALRQPSFVVTGLDLGRRDVIASVEVVNTEILARASERIACCPGVRASTPFPVET